MLAELIGVPERIKNLRESVNLTQAELARILNITRSAVNAWEIGLSVPSTQCIIQLSKIFCVSTDYLLGVSDNATISVKGLTEKQVTAVYNVIECFREDNEKLTDK